MLTAPWPPSCCGVATAMAAHHWWWQRVVSTLVQTLVCSGGCCRLQTGWCSAQPQSQVGQLCFCTVTKMDPLNDPTYFMGPIVSWLSPACTSALINSMIGKTCQLNSSKVLVTHSSALQLMLDQYITSDFILFQKASVSVWVSRLEQQLSSLGVLFASSAAASCLPSSSFTWHESCFLVCCMQCGACCPCLCLQAQFCGG